MTTIGEIELQKGPFGRGSQYSTNESGEHEAEGYGDSSTKIWQLYSSESDKHDEALVDSWKSNADCMLIFIGLFSLVVASFLVETVKTLTPSSGPSGAQSIAPSAVRVNILMFLSLFFSVTSALVSTLIQQWAREYLQYSHPSAAPHKRGRMRAYLFGGLSRFQMRRLTYCVPILLHLAVFLFFYALSEWLHSINASVGNTARYCLVALLAVYMALSVLPLIVRNAPYWTALTTPLQTCVSLIQVLYLSFRQLVRRSSRDYENRDGSGLFKSIYVDRPRALMKEIKTRASDLDRSAMQWLLQELDENDMDTFLSGLPGYIHSPLINKKLVVEGLMEDGVSGRIRDHITTCFTSVELTPEESMSRASACINSLRLISETAANTAVGRPDLESDHIQAIMEYLERHCHDPSTALRALCIRGLALREFLILLTNLDAEESRMKNLRFPHYLLPLYRVIRAWKTTQISQWPSLAGILTDTRYPLPSDQEMWEDVLYDGPLINLVVLANAILSYASEGDVNFDMTWKTFESLLKALDITQVRASGSARNRLKELLVRARGWVSEHEGGVTQISPLLKTLDIVNSGLRLAKAFSYSPKPLPPRQVEAIFGPEQLRDSELLEAFAAHLPRFVGACTPEASKSYMERLILEDKLWEQLQVGLVKCVDPQIPFPNKLRVAIAFFNILDVSFEVLNDSSNIDWQSPDLSRLLLYISDFGMMDAPGRLSRKVINSRSVIFYSQFCHALLVQFSVQRSRGEPLMRHLLPSLGALVGLLGVGSREDIENLTLGKSESVRTGFDMMTKADAILSVALHDGPLSNFLILGRTILETVVSEASDVTLDDVTKLWKVLKRVLDTPHLPLANASGEKWATFDHFRTTVLGVVAAMKGGSQNTENLQPLMDVIERVDGMRPSGDRRAGRTGSDNEIRAAGSVDQDAWEPGEVPVPGSNRDVEASRLAVGAPRDQGHFRPLLAIPTVGADQFTLYPLRITASLIPGMSGPCHAAILDRAILQAQAHMQSVLTDIPVPPRRISHLHHRPPPASSGALYAFPLGHANQDSPIRTSGYPPPSPNHEDDASE